MIADVDATLMAWLARFVPDVDITLAPPDEDPARGVPKAKARPALTLYLDSIREEPDAGELNWTSVRDDAGVTVGKMAPRRCYRMLYLLVPFSADPGAEHAILGHILMGSQLEVVLPEETMRGSIADAGQPVIARCAPANSAIDTRDLWAAWGLRPRATLELSVLAPMPPTPVVRVAGPPSGFEMGVSRLPSISRPPVAPDPDRPGPTSRITE